MAIAPVPPWLDINPTENFLKSAQVGGDLGARAEDQKIQVGQFQQSMAQKQNEMQQAFQQQQQEQQLKVKALAQQHQETAQQLQLETQKAAAQDQEAKMRMNLEWTTAAKTFQAQQQYQQVYQQLVDSGVDPDKAAMQATMQVGPTALGQNSGSTAGLWRAATEAQKASLPQNPDVQQVTSGGVALPGIYMNMNSKGGFLDLRKDNIAQENADARANAGDDKSISDMEKQIASYDSTLLKTNQFSNKREVARLVMARQALAQSLKDAGGPDYTDSSPNGGGSGGDKDPLGLFTQ